MPSECLPPAHVGVSGWVCEGVGVCGCGVGMGGWVSVGGYGWVGVGVGVGGWVWVGVWLYGRELMRLGIDQIICPAGTGSKVTPI